MRFRTSFPTRRAGLRSSVASGRGTAGRKPLPRKGRCWARWALILRRQPQGHQSGIHLADRGHLAGSADSIASTKLAS